MTIDFIFNAIDGGESTTSTICSVRSYGWGTAPVLTNSAMPTVGAGLATTPLTQMRRNFHVAHSDYHEARRRFIHKVPATATPGHLALHRLVHLRGDGAEPEP